MIIILACLLDSIIIFGTWEDSSYHCARFHFMGILSSLSSTTGLQDWPLFKNCSHCVLAWFECQYLKSSRLSNLLHHLSTIVSDSAPSALLCLDTNWLRMNWFFNLVVYCCCDSAVIVLEGLVISIIAAGNGGSNSGPRSDILVEAVSLGTQVVLYWHNADSCKYASDRRERGLAAHPHHSCGESRWKKAGYSWKSSAFLSLLYRISAYPAASRNRWFLCLQRLSGLIMAAMSSIGLKPVW